MALRLCLFGASDDTGNLGVSALLRGVLAGVAARAPDAEVVVFDHSDGDGEACVRLGERMVRHRRVGAPCTRRVHRPGSFARLAADAVAGTSLHPGSQDLRTADAVLVLAGGDSFADLYGRRRLRTVTAPMRLALRLGKPLVLLPQTYGPYEAPKAERQAGALVRRATMSWARDRDGHEALVHLAGDDHDPARHRLGIDVAFGLPPAIAEVVEDRYGEVLDGDGELVAINVSGLLANEVLGDAGRAAAYRATVLGLGRHVLASDRTARVVLVPHVVGRAPEADATACRALAAALGPRAISAPVIDDPGIVKGLIARASWFCGARMHATIAALSSGVPAAAVAYSDKFAGTFGMVGRSADVVDARDGEPDALVRTLAGSYERRHDDRPALLGAAAHARVRARLQFDDILAAART